MNHPEQETMAKHKILKKTKNKEIKDFILKQSEQERLKRKTLNMQHLDGNPEVSRMAATDSCKS